ncbi:MAG TPA: efflux RND transporter periplasmic adaptor subunit, partial [Pirellulaceae bacterium]
MKLRSLIVLGSLVLVMATVGGLVALGWHKYQTILAAQAAPPPPEMPISVLLAPVTTVSYQRSMSVIGTVIAPRSITVSNEIAGTVSEVAFESGGVVEEGQVLVKLDSRMEEAQLRASEARKRLAETTLKRLRSIRGADAISQVELDEAVARRDEAAASVAELSAMIARRSILAPFRARVGLSDTHVGQYLPGGTSITTLQSLDGYLLIDFMMSQEVADVVQAGDDIRFETPGGTLTARLVAFEALADRGTRNLRARARVDDPPEWMQPGDSVRVTVDYGPKVETTAVPVQAV